MSITIWVYKPDGTVQCEDTKENTLEQAREELASLVGDKNILKGEKRSVQVASLCGLPTGKRNAFELTEEGFILLRIGFPGSYGWKKWDDESSARLRSASEVWTAWYNAQPLGPVVLNVVGSIQVAKTESAKLVYAGIEKSNPPNLLLEIEKEPNIFIPRAEGDKVTLHYSEVARIGTYNSIKIFLGGSLVKTIDGSEIGIAH